MKASTRRLILRCIHLVVAIPVIGYIYQPPAEATEYAGITRFAFVPVALFTGYWMYMGLAWAFIGVAMWLAATYFVGIGTAILSQIGLFIIRKIWMMAQKPAQQVAAKN